MHLDAVRLHLNISYDDVNNLTPVQDFKGTNFAKIKADGDQMEANRVQRYQKAKEQTDSAELANEALPTEWTLKSNPLLPGLTESGVKAMFLQDHPLLM